MFYFLLDPYVAPNKANYQHACIVLAEGMKQLNMPYSANIDYYPDISGAYLFNKTEHPTYTYIITSSPENHAATIIQEAQNGRRLIIIDTKDEWVRPKSAQYLQFCYRYFMSTCKITTNQIRPYCFAASNRMLEATSAPSLPWLSRNPDIVWAHRVDNHSISNTVKEYYSRKKYPLATFLDNFTTPTEPNVDTHHWNHTGRRHSPAYFEYLRQHRYLDAHGGYLKTKTEIIQWDSWKVWEGLLSGMLVITADLDYYNIKLPHRLIPYKHYIPVRYDQIQASYEALFRLPDIEQQVIANEGRKFVLEHYTPQAMAAYFSSQL